MTKTIKKIFKNIKNKTIRKKNYKLSSCKKREFIKAILKEWKNQTSGCYEKDKMTIYEGDYYLSFNKKCDFYNHIHLVLKNFSNDKNIHNNFLYVMKKMDKKDNKIVHSPEIKINVLSDPKIVVRNMIINYKNFSKL
jgi:hypothetical protein